MGDTSDQTYTERLRARSGARWKGVLDVQAPYRWNLRRQGLGRTLDIGCGIGRNLANLSDGSVGVDHNPTSVAECRARGLAAFTSDEWESERRSATPFDSLLLAHVVEHMTIDEGREVLRSYLRDLRPGGTVFFICPQERGYSSDETHVSWMDGERLTDLARDVGLVPELWRSFPFPRAVGRFFTYNEFTLLARSPT